MNNSCERQIEIEIGNDNQTIPSCNDCAVTIITTPIPRFRKVIGTTCPAFREEKRLLFGRIPEFGGFSGENCNSLFYELLASGHDLNLFLDYEKLGVKGKG